MARYGHRWLTTSEMCEELRISERTLWRMKARGDFNSPGLYRRKTRCEHSTILWNGDRILALMGAIPAEV
ncbi:MAG: helix-turn-helix transcriptional regulator [Burkholderiaceae bacterium]